MNGMSRNRFDGVPRNLFTTSGDRLDQSGDILKDYLPMDYFFFSFPIEKIDLTIRLTNSCLHAKGNKLLDEREFYKFLGIIILITRLEFASRAKLWFPTSEYKYIPAVKLGKMTGMSRNRFDEIWSELRWSDQPDIRPPEMSHAEYRWLLVDDMVDIFNSHREDSVGRYSDYHKAGSCYIFELRSTYLLKSCLVGI